MTQQKNGADVLCDTLLANDVRMCFANPGTSEMHFVAALDRKPELRCVLGLFEGVVTGMADGYARMAQQPAATLLHLGPGLANGLANLHNARRAGSPVINIVGDHASYHLELDAPLTTDIEALARPMSGWVKTIAGSDAVARDTAQAIAAARSAPGHVATLILPADAAWDQTAQAAALAPAATPPQATQQQIEAAAAALRNGRKTLILLNGPALRGAALETAGRIAMACGARLAAERSGARIERGAGRVVLERIPYKIEAALANLAEVEQVILVGAKEPVAFFAYPGKPGRLLPQSCRSLALAEPHQDLAAALEQLALALGVGADAPFQRQPAELPDAPGGALDARAVLALVARALPENAIVCDEAISSGQHLLTLTRGAPAHDYLPLTGGAIGLGLPLGTGAALACPERKVVCLQADGSAMYTLQALWTQARERLDVLTVIFANQSYNILHGELQGVGAGEAGRNARRMLDLVDPALDWVSLARGVGVEAVCCTTAAQLESALLSAMRRRGPMLIEARI